MSKPTKDEMDKFIKYHQRGLFMARKMLEIDRNELDTQLILGDAIRALIESSDKEPEVDEDWLIDKANSVLHALRHRFCSAITAEDTANMRNLLADVVIAGGIKVKED